MHDEVWSDSLWANCSVTFPISAYIKFRRRWTHCADVQNTIRCPSDRVWFAVGYNSSNSAITVLLLVCATKTSERAINWSTSKHCMFIVGQTTQKQHLSLFLHASTLLIQLKGTRIKFSVRFWFRKAGSFIHPTYRLPEISLLIFCIVESSILWPFSAAVIMPMSILFCFLKGSMSRLISAEINTMTQSVCDYLTKQFFLLIRVLLFIFQLILQRCNLLCVLAFLF